MVSIFSEKNMFTHIYLSHANKSITAMVTKGRVHKVSRANIELQILEGIDKSDFPTSFRIVFYSLVLHTSTFDIYWFGQQNLHGLTNDSIARMKPDMSLLGTLPSTITLPDFPLELSRESSPESSVSTSETSRIGSQPELDKLEGPQATPNTSNGSVPECNIVTNGHENGDHTTIVSPGRSMNPQTLGSEPVMYAGRLSRYGTRSSSKTPQPRLQLSNIINGNGLATPHPTDDGEETWGQETISDRPGEQELDLVPELGLGSGPPIDPSLMGMTEHNHHTQGGKTVPPPPASKKRGGSARGRGGKAGRGGTRKQAPKRTSRAATTPARGGGKGGGKGKGKGKHP